MRKLIILTLAAATLALPALADDHGRGRGRGHDDSVRHESDDRRSRSSGSNDSVELRIDRNLNVRFSTRDLNVIIDWFDREPVIRESRGLPPGLAKQLRERGHLPPGLEAKGLPPGLADRLGPPPRGYDRVVIGHDVVLIEIATGVIADIIRSVF